MPVLGTAERRGALLTPRRRGRPANSPRARPERHARRGERRRSLGIDPHQLLLRSRCHGWAIAGDAGRDKNQISVAAAPCAITDYAASHRRPEHAIAIPAAMSGFLVIHGYGDESAALHQSALAAARQAGDRLGEADTLDGLGVLQGDAGNYPAAAASLARAVVLYGDAGHLPGQAHALTQLAYLYVLTADYPAAAASAQQALAPARSASDRSYEADALIHLGLVQQLTGDYPAAATSQQRALALCRDLGNLEGGLANSRVYSDATALA